MMSGLFSALYDPTAQASQTVCLRDGQPIRLGQLWAAVETLAATLPTGRISLFSDYADHFLVGLLAIWHRGGLVVLPASGKAGYLAEIAANYDAHLGDDQLSQAMAAPALNACPPRPLPAAESCIMVFFTSGSTGAPKAISKTLAQIESEVEVQQSLWAPTLSPQARVLGLVSHQHIYGLIFRLLWPAINGRVFIAEQIAFWDTALEQMDEGDILVASPAHLQRLPNAPTQTIARPGLLVSSGGPLSHAAAQASVALFGCLPSEIYGSTETGGMAWRQQSRPNTAWTPLPSVKVARADDGCLRVQAPHIDGVAWYQTSDQIAFDQDQGRFILGGRADRLVKIEGKRVSLDEVERRLKDSALVAEAVVFPRAQQPLRLAAILVLSAQGQQTLDQVGTFRTGRLLRAALAPVVDDAALPQHWRFVGQIPTDSQGKRPQSLLESLFTPSQQDNSPVSVPLVLQQDHQGNTAQLRLSLDPELLYFHGHFEQMPLLPGVVQLHWAALYAQNLFGTPPAPNSISHLKFTRPIPPNSIVELHLDHDPTKQQVKFRFEMQGVDCSRGTLSWTQTP